MLIELAALTAAVADCAITELTEPLYTTTDMPHMVTRLAPNNGRLILQIRAPKGFRIIARILVWHVTGNIGVAKIQLANCTARLRAFAAWTVGG